MTQTTRGSGFISCYLGQEDVCIGISYNNHGLKAPHCLTMTNYAGIGGRRNVYLPGRVINVWRVFLVCGGAVTGA